MGTGDWNDGMNKVGAGGKGESVWVAWFQIAICKEFARVAAERGDTQRANECRNRAEQLRQAIEAHAWDGAWYLRAFYDDGSPLGSAKNLECQIDSLTQSWAVISGAGDPERSRRAMQSVLDSLVRWRDKLVLLFDPPFDIGLGPQSQHPGYIKGYVPGIRENGGQYTHAACWVVLALAQLGRSEEAFKVWNLLDPIRHGETIEEVARYRVEPYVVAGDVYGRPPHVGRGGWTWYTGSAGWLYRVGLEAVLGFRREGDRLRIAPCIPKEWEGFRITYRHGSAIYHIRVENRGSGEQPGVWLDGEVVPEGLVTLAEDGREHEVRVVLG
jgi:cellobiose phosphorylase